MITWQDRNCGSSRKRNFFLWLMAIGCWANIFVVKSAVAQTFIELYPFNSSPIGLADGAWPEAGLVRDVADNLYGTTFLGGGGTGCDINVGGCGVVFKVDPSGKETVLHSFSGPRDGWNPAASLVLDAAGNLYGTTEFGGAHGFGAVFKIDAAGNEKILHDFAGGRDGANPNAGLVQDASGNFYGTTQYGGCECEGQGCGTVFKISASGQETILHRFRGGADGASPLGGVAVDPSGNVYGTTWLGGSYGFGTVFRIDSNGQEKVLHHFAAENDGANPVGGLVLDQAGNLYGTASAAGAFHIGTVFTVNTAGDESILYTFTGGSDGAYPLSNLILDGLGNLYGTTSQAGAVGGSVFELSGSTVTVLYDFLGTTGPDGDGADSMAGLVLDSQGNLYGTVVQQGTHGWGAVFEIQRNGQ